jgi:amino acid adenylation domain-containing protein
MSKFNVLEAIANTANATPFKTAIDYVTGRMTYAELEARSNEIANCLISNGAAKGATVVVLVEKSEHAIISMIGILKAGCVFVPTDTRVPASRIQAMISEVKAQWVITESTVLALASGFALFSTQAAKIICVDCPHSTRQNGVETLSPSRYAFESVSDGASRAPAPDDLCYVYFTSGSTDTPKGIAGRIKGINHFIEWEIKTFGVDHTFRISQLTTPSFDAFFRDVFTPLCAGGTVCAPARREIILAPSDLIDWANNQQINLIHCVPSLFRSILNGKPAPEDFQSLKYVLMSGEPLLPSDVRRWIEIFGERIQLVNLYGPSETTMIKFFYMVKSSDKDRRSVPIGKPMSGAAALLLDSQGNVCPKNAVGEIYIRTPFRTLGYYNRPDMTREKFVSNPFNNDPEDRIFKTGDLARMLDDGNYEFLGRIDHQVKIRGHRIELKEIENAFRSHVAIKDVVVVDYEGPDGEKALCAYVVSDEPVDSKSLKTFLATSLPYYMVPRAIVAMNDLPRTVSGKVDRLSLPDPALWRSEASMESAQPKSETEKILANIWAAALNLDQISVDDNFFNLGGNSLMLAQVSARIRASFNVDIPLADLFMFLTVEELAEAVEQAILAKADSDNLDRLLDLLESTDDEEARNLLGRGDS